MKEKIIGFLVICLFMGSFVLSARPESEAAVPDDGLPQYGGTLTAFYSYRQTTSPPNPAISRAMYTALLWLSCIQDYPVIGDVEKFGPRGSDEWHFHYYYWMPEQYLTGDLAESWELRHDRLTFHVRPGVYWSPTKDQMARGVMDEPREVTAEDFRLDIIRFFKSPWHSRFIGYIDIENAETVVWTEDRYTVHIDIDSYHDQLFYWFTYEDRGIISPPETELANPERWENQIGTGPWQFEEYVTDAHMSFVRNPIYWKTTTIDGAEYELPFVDRLVLPIMPDDSTRLAAVLTGKFDMAKEVPHGWWDTLDQRAPRLGLNQLNHSLGRGAGGVWMRTDRPPFDDLRARQALYAGTDMMAFAPLFETEGMQRWYFPGVLPDHDAAVKLTDVPESVSRLYTYNPTLAKELLKEAGYDAANPLRTEMHVGPDGAVRDAAAILQDQWAKINVDLTINAVDATSEAALTTAFAPPDYKPLYEGTHFRMGAGVRAGLYMIFFFDSRGGNIAGYSNPEYNALLDKIAAEVDIERQNQLVHEAGLMLAKDALVVPAPPQLQPSRIVWWPWVQNYYGEATVADDLSWTHILRFVWIDQALKREMGYR